RGSCRGPDGGAGAERRGGAQAHPQEGPQVGLIAGRVGPPPARSGRVRCGAMAIDFTLSPELEAIRARVRTFIDEVVRPGEARIGDPDEIERDEYLRILFGMRDRAKEEGLWLPHMPEEWGGMGLGH